MDFSRTFPFFSPGTQSCPVHSCVSTNPLGTPTSFLAPIVAIDYTVLIILISVGGFFPKKLTDVLEFTGFLHLTVLLNGVYY